MKRAFATAGICAMIGLTATPTLSAPTSYPLTIENCGVEVTFNKAPERAVALGQNSAEIMLLLGLEGKMVGTAFWPNKVMPELAEANSKVKVLTVEFPTFEAILAQSPDFVASALPSLIGPSSKVAKREDFEKVGVSNYLSPSTCVKPGIATDKFGYGDRDGLWSMEEQYKEIEDLAKIFDVQDRGAAVIADFKKREAALRSQMSKHDKKLSYVFWFSSPSPSADAYLGGKNSASGFIADVLGGSNAIQSEAESPALGWESIIASNPDVVVVAQVDRNRWDLDKSQAKIDFLKSDPGTSKMPAVKNNAIVVINGQAMNPSVQTIGGAEQIAEQLKSLGLR